MLAAALALLVIAALLALATAHRVPPDQERDAVVLAVLLGVEAASVAVQFDLTAHLVDDGPYEGAARGIFHLTQILFTAWPAAVAALAVLLLARCSPVSIGAVWGVGIVAVCARYPALRGEDLERVYLGAEVLWVAVGAASVVLLARRRRRPTLEQVCTMVLVAGELVVLAGPYKLGIWHTWPAAQLIYLAVFGAVAALQARHLWITRSWRTSSAS